MKTAAARLVAALDELILAESIALGAEDIASAAAVQNRAAPVIAALAAAARTGQIAAALIPQLRSILERRQENRARLGAMMALRRRKLSELQVRRRRLNGLSPAYGKPKRRSRFAARA